MKRLLSGIVLSCSLAAVWGLASPVQGQQPAPAHGGVDAAVETDLIPSPPPTPEMWYYLQETRRYDDPKQAIRRKAEMKSAQRRDRLAALKWYGYSNSRPLASPLPFMGDYSPTWVGNSWHPYRWHSGYTTSLLIVGDRVQY